MIERRFFLSGIFLTFSGIKFLFSLGLIFFLDLCNNLFVSSNNFSGLPHSSIYLQDFFGDFSELWAIFRGLKSNSGFSGIILILEIKIIPKP